MRTAAAKQGRHNCARRFRRSAVVRRCRVRAQRFRRRRNPGIPLKWRAVRAAEVEKIRPVSPLNTDCHRRSRIAVEQFRRRVSEMQPESLVGKRGAHLRLKCRLYDRFAGHLQACSGEKSDVLLRQLMPVRRSRCGDLRRHDPFVLDSAPASPVRRRLRPKLRSRPRSFQEISPELHRFEPRSVCGIGNSAGGHLRGYLMNVMLADKERAIG